MTSPQLPTELHGNVLVAGAGISGAGSARMLVDLGASVTVADDDETARLRVSEITGADNTSVTDVDLSRYSCVVTSPGWRPTTPLLVDAANQGIPVIGDVELCWRLDRSGVFGPPRTWLAVTGTNGKTTTTAMLAAMMNTVPVGNIGVAVSDALTSGNDILVVELSSFQLHWSSTIRPAAGCLLNLADDHIDWHGSFDNYRADKAKVLLGDVAVVGIDDPNLAGYDAIGFTLSAPARGQVGIVDGMIVDNAFGDNVVIASAEGISPAGPAGQLDALAATAMARSQGIEPHTIAKALATFEVSGHRGQVVHHAGGVSFVDNSKATNPHAAEAALSGCDSIIWVAGGQLKGADITQLVANHASRMKAALLLGVDRHILQRELEKYSVPTMVTDSTDPEVAMQELMGYAASIAEPGDTVVLAPAAASLDMYSGMSQRGNLFAHYAKEQL